MIIITDQHHRVVSVSLLRGSELIPIDYHYYESDDTPREGTIYPPYSNKPELPPMPNLTISDLIAMRDYCHERSLDFSIGKDEGLKWHDRFKQVDKELSERVEKIFEGK